MVANDDDLKYDGRARKRPPGPGPITLQLYKLLVERGEGGLTYQEAEQALRYSYGTDAYRAYERRLKQRRMSIRDGVPDRHSRAGEDRFCVREGGRERWLPISTPTSHGSPQYTEEFMRYARISDLQHRLKNMGRKDANGRAFAFHRGDRWYVGDRVPVIVIECEAGVRHRVEYDPRKHRDDNRRSVERMHVIEEMRAALSTKRIAEAEARTMYRRVIELWTG